MLMTIPHASVIELLIIVSARNVPRSAIGSMIAKRRRKGVLIANRVTVLLHSNAHQERPLLRIERKKRNKRIKKERKKNKTKQ